MAPLLAVSALVVVAASAALSAPDPRVEARCTSAMDAVSVVICGDADLLANDVLLNHAFAELRLIPDSRRMALTAGQRVWLRARNALCLSGATLTVVRSCLQASTRDRLAALNQQRASQLEEGDVFDIGNAAVEFVFDGDGPLRARPGTPGDLAIPLRGRTDIVDRRTFGAVPTLLVSADRGGTMDCGSYDVLENRSGRGIAQKLLVETCDNVPGEAFAVSATSDGYRFTSLPLPLRPGHARTWSAATDQVTEVAIPFRPNPGTRLSLAVDDSTDVLSIAQMYDAILKVEGPLREALLRIFTLFENQGVMRQLNPGHAQFGAERRGPLLVLAACLLEYETKPFCQDSDEAVTIWDSRTDRLYFAGVERAPTESGRPTKRTLFSPPRPEWPSEVARTFARWSEKDDGLHGH